MRLPRSRAPLLAAGVWALAACNGDGSACVEGLSASCAPLYPPTFDNIYTRTLAPTCAQPGSACHGSSGVQGGLFFVSADTAYALLLGEVDGHPRVIPGNPACSVLVERIDDADPSAVMPPEAELSAAERCGIVQWISQGATR